MPVVFSIEDVLMSLHSASMHPVIHPRIHQIVDLMTKFCFYATFTNSELSLPIIFGISINNY